MEPCVPGALLVTFGAMKTIFALCGALAVALSVGGVARADLDLPRPSPFAKVVQTVGLTDITVDYSSPGVKGRKIWGAVVPYDQMWRAGAKTWSLRGQLELVAATVIDGEKAPCRAKKGGPVRFSHHPGMKATRNGGDAGEP